MGGGSTRQDSVRAGLERCADTEVTCVHDAARPLCPPRVFPAVVAAATASGAATAALECIDTIKRIDGNRVVATLDRTTLVAVQTPQAFITKVLRIAHDRAFDDDFHAEDDCGLVEHCGGKVVIVDGDPLGFKVTWPGDLVILRALAREEVRVEP